MHEFQRLNSVEDNSVNWVIPAPNGLFFEARLVERGEGHYILYVSSQSGCAQKCKFCHLTQTGQFVGIVDADENDFEKQVTLVLGGLLEDKHESRLKRLSVSFMARGEPLDRPNFIEDFLNLKQNIVPNLLKQVRLELIPVKYKISTIFPVTRAKYFDSILKSLVEHDDTLLYWSLYSLDYDFRRRWLPNASDPYLLAPMLSSFFAETGRLRIHSAWIEGQNDREEHTIKLAKFLGDDFPFIRFNHVAYNPYYRQAVGMGKESTPEIIARNNKILEEHDIEVKSIVRVGMDVKASCGMFVS